MNRVFRLLFCLLSVLSLCQCTLPSPGLHTCPIVLPGTSEVVAFKLKAVSGVARQSQIMAAMENVNSTISRDAEAKKNPLSKLAHHYSPGGEHEFALIAQTGTMIRKDGHEVSAILPLAAFRAPHVPEMMLVRVVPEMQAYIYRVMSREFVPLRTSELIKPPKRR